MLGHYPSLGDLQKLSNTAFYLLVALDGARGTQGCTTVDSARLAEQHGLAAEQIASTLAELQAVGLVLCLEATGTVFITQRGHRFLEALRIFESGADRRTAPVRHAGAA